MGEDFPAIQLYHAEHGLVETLPAGWQLWNISETDEWLFLYEEVGTNVSASGPRGYSRYNLWARRLEDVGLESVGGQWHLVAPAMNTLFWNDDQSEIAFTQNEKTVVWQTFPEGGTAWPLVQRLYRQSIPFFSKRPFPGDARQHSRLARPCPLSVRTSWERGQLARKRRTSCPRSQMQGS
ncbi:MAG: hypothetical protein M5U34_34120 [Chloroflexi bacterium]|nr:hypothetical protein [Chloroflexota bacterium]